ncbi:MAG: condensation domain-containing protein, partial [Candidatus Omnitrophota bacterium]
PKNTNPKTKSFWSHLFSKRWAAGGILYKTGDLVRWVSGGYVEYLGRIDQQVKVRGFRIELEEIENQLLRNKQIKDAVVMLTETGHTGKDEDAAITAYIVSSEPLLASDCRLELMKTLPAYMVPAAFIQVDKIPLTPNGKADKKALALLGQKLGTGETQVLPQTEIEKSIAGAWQDVLKLDTVGIYDNFFDIGGNSIKIIQVSARLKQQLGMNIPINKMFHYPTIHGLADYLEQWNRNETSVMETEGEVRERVTVWENVEEELSKNLRLTSLLKKNNLYRSYDVSSPQLSFLLNIKQIERQNIAFSYDLYHSNEAEGDDKIQRIVIQMINQNALLRSVIVNQSGLFVVEEYDSYMNIDIPFIDLSKDPVDYQEDVQGMIAAYLEQPFEVIDRVLFRVAVVKLSENHYRLLFVFNHLVFDGGSYSVLEEQIEQARKEVNEGSDRTRNSIDSYDYYDYAAFLNQLNYDTINLENHLPVSTYLRQVDRVRDVFDKRQLQRVSFEVDLSMLKPEKQHLYHEILFFAYARLIGDLYGIANVPLIFYSYGRNYKNGNFNKMIGTFQDFVPVLIDLKEKPGLVLEAFLAYREYIKEVDLNFTNFIRKKYREREEYVKLMATPFKFNPIFGIYERLKHTAEEGVAPALDPQRFGSDTIICELMASKDTHSEKVMLRLVHNTPFGVAEWTEKFIEYVKTVVDYFNTTM